MSEAQCLQPEFVNVSSYKFMRLENLLQLKEKLLTECHARQFKGTILLAHEGINLFVSGHLEDIESFQRFIATETPIGEMAFKLSRSQEKPFRRMLVRLKKEIVTMGVEDFDAEREKAPYVDAQTLKAWLDDPQRRQNLVLLDTRNRYEIDLGTFEGAEDLNIDTFRHFPQEVQSKKEAYEGKTIVTFCTGGIRCEKAAPMMKRLGFENVYQLDGGILKYFETCEGAHWQGECFVFDQRVAVDPQLQETATEQCFACRHPLSPMEQRSPLYRVGISCPHCHPRSHVTTSQESCEHSPH